jgi:hypothetical protein
MILENILDNYEEPVPAIMNVPECQEKKHGRGVSLSCFHGIAEA